MYLPKKPKQSFWDKIKDIPDANSPMDQYKRQQSGAPVIETNTLQNKVLSNPVTRDIANARVSAGNNANITSQVNQSMVNMASQGNQRAQRYVDKPFVSTPQNIRYAKGLEDATTNVGLGLYRSGIGTAQGLGGTYDLLTPGEGENRLSDWSTKKAEEADATAERMDMKNKAYHTSQFLGDALTFMSGSGVIKGGLTAASNIPKISAAGAKVISSPLAKPVVSLNSKFNNAATKAASTSTKWGNAKSNAIRAIKDPANIAETLVDTSIGTGQIAARGDDVGPLDIGLNFGASAGLGVGMPMAGAYVKPVVSWSGDVLKKGVTGAAEGIGNLVETGSTFTKQALDKIGEMNNQYGYLQGDTPPIEKTPTGNIDNNYMDTLRERAANADPNAPKPQDANNWGSEQVYSDLLNSGLSKQDIDNITRTYGANANDWRVAMNQAGSLDNAKNPAGVLVENLKKIKGTQVNNPVVQTPTTDNQFVNTPTQPIKQTDEIKLADLSNRLENQLDDKSYANLMAKVNNIKNVDGKLAYIQKVITNNLNKNKKVLENVARVELEDGTVTLVSKDTGEVLGTFHKDNVLDESELYSKLYNDNKSVDFTSRNAINETPEGPAKPYTDVGNGKVIDENGNLYNKNEVPAGSVKADITKPTVTNKDRPVVTAKDEYGNTVNAETGDILDTPSSVKTEQPSPQQNTAQPEPATPNVELGDMSRSLYESGEDVGYSQVKSLGDRIAQKIDEQFKAIGSSFDSVARKIQAGVRDGKTTHLEAGLTPEESRVLTQAQNEMNYMRERARAAGQKDVGEGNFGEMYLPNVATTGPKESLLKGFVSKIVGSEKTRKNAIPLETLDYDAATVGDYIVRYGDSTTYNKNRISETLRSENPNATTSNADKAAEIWVDFQDKANRLVTKIGLGGAGRRRVVVDNKTLSPTDTLQEMSGLLGKEVIDINGSASILNVELGNKLKSIPVGDSNLFEASGMGLYRDAKTMASSQHSQGGDIGQVADSLYNRLVNKYGVDPKKANNMANGYMDAAGNAPENIQKSILQGIYQNAAKKQMIDFFMTHRITDRNLKKHVDQALVQILREGTMEQALSQKLVKGTLATTNALFRKLNLSSAINEMSDLPGFKSVYGKYFTAIPDPGAAQRYGLDDIDPSTAAYLEQVAKGSSPKEVAKTINNKTNLYKFVEAYKMAVAATSGEKYFKAKGLEGDELTKAVLDTYREIALPVDMFTKTFLDNAPLWTQYMSWGVRNLNKEGRLLTGQSTAGVLGEKEQLARIARNLYVNIPAKTAFWLASNALKGTPFMVAMGLTDFTGLTSGDYSGIEEEDKSFADKYVIPTTNASTMGSILGTAYQSYEKERLKDSEKYAGAEYNPYESNNMATNAAKQFTPQAIKNLGVPTIEDGKVSLKGGAIDLNKKGYSENAKGLVQFEAPNSGNEILDKMNIAKSYTFGKNQTPNAREYSGKLNLIDRIAKKGEALQNESLSIAGAIKEIPGDIKNMVLEQMDFKDTDFNFPLNEKYSKLYKDTVEAGGKLTAKTQDIVNSYRSINKDKKQLAQNEPNTKKILDSSSQFVDGKYNTISPEKWSKFTGSDEATDKAFEFQKSKADRNAKDFGEPVDPIYNLPKNQRAEIATLRGMKTGDDLELKGKLGKEQWYKDFKAAEREYFDKINKVATEDGMPVTDRVKQYRALQAENPDIPENTAAKYPGIAEYFRIKDQDEDAAKAFSKNNDLSAEFDAKDKEAWEWTNKMRKMEGGSEIAWDTWQNESFGYEDDEAKLARNLYFKNKGSGGSYGGSYGSRSGGGSGGGSGGSSDEVKPTISAAKYLGDAKEVSTSTKVKKPTVSIKKAKVKTYAVAKPKVSIVKSKV